MKLFPTDERWQLASAIFLALIAGYVDGYGLLFLGTYVSFMSGNTTSVGLRIGQGNFRAALPPAIAVLSFVAGSFVGNFLTKSKLGHSHRAIFGLIASLLATVSGLGWLGHRNVSAEIAMLCLAMGMMNPALTKIGAESVSITFMTGTLSRIGGHLAAAAGSEPLTARDFPGDSHLNRARTDAIVWSGFLLGAALSGMAHSHFQMWALLPPGVFMVGLALFSEAAA
jgi:uncharacterized membrane protein YoaK (UPF0700 family)